MEKNEAGQGGKESQRGGVAVLNHISKKGFYKTVTLNQGLKEVREGLEMKYHQVQTFCCGSCSGTFEEQQGS